LAKPPEPWTRGCEGASCRTLSQLDPAILRPGRLLGSREFRRLTRPEAQRLAQAKGLKLADQPDYSLAEIYNSAANGPGFNGGRQIGFAQ
jgi:hypothetical protein